MGNRYYVIKTDLINLYGKLNCLSIEEIFLNFQILYFSSDNYKVPGSDIILKSSILIGYTFCGLVPVFIYKIRILKSKVINQF